MWTEKQVEGEQTDGGGDVVGAQATLSGRGRESSS